MDMQAEPVAAETNGVAVLEEAPTPVPTYPDKLSEEDRLTIENIFLKLQNAQLTVQKLDADKAQLLEQMQKFQAEMTTRRAELSKKYGIDIGRANVMSDGTIVRNPPPGFSGVPGRIGR